MADKDMVQAVLTDESVWPFITEDNTPDSVKENIAEMYLSNPSVYVLNPGPGIIFLLCPFNSVTFMLHTAIIKASRGKEAIKQTKKAQHWFFENTQAQKIISVVPSFNRQALLFALKAGGKKEGNMTKSFMKNGILHDQVLIGKNRGG